MNRLSTRTRFVLTSVALLIPILVVAGIVLDETLRRSQEQLVVTEYATADVVAQSVFQLVDGTESSLIQLAQAEPIRAIDQRPDEAAVLMDEFRSSRPSINGVFLIGSDYAPIRTSGGVDLENLPPEFHMAAESAISGGQPAVSDTLLLKTGEVEVVAIVVPVFPNPNPAANTANGTPVATQAPQAPSGAIGAFFSVERLVAGFLPSTGFTSGSDISVALVTSSGQIVSIPGRSSDPGEIFQDGPDLNDAIKSALGGQRTQTAFVDPEGLHRVTVAVPIAFPGNDWAVVVSGPDSRAFGPTRNLIHRSILAFAAAVILSIVVAVIAAQWLSRPFRLLTDQASAVSRGDTVPMLDAGSPHDAAQLGLSIRDMADRLRTQIRNTETAREEIARQAHLLRDLLRRTVRLQEDERRRIASDIHDAVSPLITGALYQAQAVRLSQSNGKNGDHANGNGTGEDHGPVVADDLRAVGDLLERAMRELHDVIFDLRPPDLDDIGIVAALQRHVDQVNRSGLPCTLEVIGEEHRLPPEVRLAIYRIVQESLHNAIRHAHADEAIVRIEWSGDRLRVAVQDDGSGFDLDNTSRRSGLGLMSMRERASSIGATLEIVTRAGSGTVIVVDRLNSDVDLAVDGTGPVDIEQIDDGALDGDDSPVAALEAGGEEPEAS